jgi:heptosyltransferase I
MTRTIPIRDPRRIVLIKPSALGDIMHSLPVLSALRVRFPSAHLAWLVNRAYEPLLRGHPDLDATIPFDRGLFRSGWRSGCVATYRFAADLRARRFDLAIDLQGLFRTGVLSFLTGAPVRLGLTSTREAGSLFHTHRIHDGGTVVHAVERYWRIVEALGGGDLPKRFRLPIAAEARSWALERLADCPRPWIAVGVGSRWLTKRWLPTHFAELVRRAQAQFGGTALFIGTPDERPLAEQTAAAISGPKVQLAGETTLTQLAGVLAESDVVVANDTGPLHLAVALGKPVVAPYTCTQVRKTGPFGQFERAAETTVWCRGSEVQKCARLECMSELTPDRMWPLLDKVLRTCNRLSA